jgi:hypothetical protein
MIRFLFRLVLLALLLLLLGFLFFPNVVSTKWGKASFFKVYKSMTGNTLTADTFEISWWKGQKFENITIVYPREKATFIGPMVTTDATLWQLIFSHNLGNMEMTSPQVIINADLPLPVKKKIAQVSQAGFLPHITASIPMKSMPHYLGHVIVHQGNVKFLSKDFDPIELQDVSLDVSLLKSQIKLKGTGTTSQGSVKGDFDLSLVYNPSQSQIDLIANLQNFPMRSIDQTVAIFEPNLKGVLLGSIGEAINVQLKLQNLPQTLALFCDATSPSFSAHIETATKDGIVSLATPALIQFQIPQAFLIKVLGLPLKHPFQVQLKIDSLSLPLADRESFSFQATLKGDALQFPFGTFQPFALFLSTDNFKNRHFTLKVDSPQVQLNTALYLPDQWQQMTWTGEGLFPSNTRVNFSAQTLSAITATVQGDKWQGNFSGGFDPAQNVVFLNKPAEIVYHVTQLPSPLPPLLDQPTVLHAEIQPLRVSLSNLNGPIAFKLRADPTVIKGLSLGETVISATGDLKSRTGTFDLTSTVNQGKVSASGSFGWPQDLVAKASLVQFPTSFIDLFLGTDQLAPILGSTLNATADISYLPQKKLLSFDLNAGMISAQASLEKTDTALKLTKPAKVTLNLTPEGYASLDHLLNKTPTPFILNQPAMVKASITDFTIPCCETFDLSKLSCQADLSIDTLNFSGKNSTKNTQLNGMQLHLDHSATAPMVFSLTANGAPDGSISLKGSLDFSTGMLDLNCRLDQFPSTALDVVSRSFGKSSVSMATLFGSQVNLTASATLSHWNGPVKLQLNSPNIRTSLNGSIANGLLHLNEALHMQMTLTPDLSRVLLNSVNPLSLSAITAEAPITLEIPAQGFSYPIYPSTDALINIPSGRLELGKLYCHNEGNVNITLGLLKLSQFSQNQNLELWFAPLDFHIVNGVMECERTEILIANTYQVCIWGDLNFVKRKVDMVLGLTASCLKTAFGITNLPDDYVLQIPMTGSFDNVKINTTKATAKIAALLLWQQKAVSGAFGKSSAGAVLGQFMSKLGPLPDGNSKAPPPKRPFPWESGEQKASSKKKKTSEAEPPTKKKKLIVPGEQPFKQVLKMLR